SLAGDQIAPSEVRRSRRRIYKVAPDADDFDTILVSSAIDACNALYCTLSYILEPNVNRVIEVAVSARDTADRYVQELEDLEPMAPDLEARILKHPLMQRELKKQQDDLDQLQRVPTLTPEFLTKFRQTASYAGRSNLNLQ